MKNSKLIKILKLLTKKELKGFGDFVNSPYCNRNKKCIALYELLLPYAPDFTNPRLGRSNFLDCIYTNKNSINSLFNEFIELIEKYMIEEQFKEQKGLSKYFLLEELRKRGEQKHFNLVYKRSLKKITNDRKSIQRYYEKYLIELSNLEMLNGLKLNQKVLAGQLENVIESFDKYVLSNHLRLDSTILNELWVEPNCETDNITNHIIPNSKIFMNLVKDNSYKNEVLIELHLLLRQLQDYKTEENHQFLFDALKKNYKFIEKEDYNYFYKYLINYCVQEIVKGNVQLYDRVLDIYLFAMEIGAFIEGEYLDTRRMKNIVITCVKVNKVDLAEKLFSEYFKLINPSYQTVTMNYCKGYIHFHKKEYEIAINYLSECLNSRDLFELDAQTILYKIYYETQQNWAFDIPVQSFITRLTRRKDRYFKGHMEGYLNFFRILKQIYRKKEDPTYGKSVEDITQRLNLMKYNSDKKWLLGKLRELRV